MCIRDRPLGRREIKGVAAVFFSDIDCRLDADEIASVVLDLIGQSYRRLLPGVGVVVGIVVISCTQHGCRCEQRARQRAQSVMGRVFHTIVFNSAGFGKTPRYPVFLLSFGHSGLLEHDARQFFGQAAHRNRRSRQATQQPGRFEKMCIRDRTCRAASCRT